MASSGYESQDAKTYADMGVDYLKVSVLPSTSPSETYQSPFSCV